MNLQRLADKSTLAQCCSLLLFIVYGGSQTLQHLSRVPQVGHSCLVEKHQLPELTGVSSELKGAHKAINIALRLQAASGNSEHFSGGTALDYHPHLLRSNASGYSRLGDYLGSPVAAKLSTSVSKDGCPNQAIESTSRLSSACDPHQQLALKRCFAESATPRVGMCITRSVLKGCTQ